MKSDDRGLVVVDLLVVYGKRRDPSNALAMLFASMDEMGENLSSRLLLLHRLLCHQQTLAIFSSITPTLRDLLLSQLNYLIEQNERNIVSATALLDICVPVVEKILFLVFEADGGSLDSPQLPPPNTKQESTSSIWLRRIFLHEANSLTVELFASFHSSFLL